MTISIFTLNTLADIVNIFNIFTLDVKTYVALHKNHKLTNVKLLVSQDRKTRIKK